MKKFILLTTVSILLGACGGDGTKDTAKEMSKDTNNTITTEMVATPVNAEPTPVPAQAQENTPVDPTEIDKQALVDEAKMITKAFGTELKGELQAAMQAGGALNALDVCHTKAMEITDSSSNQHNAQVSRVSLKNRNPDNVPNDWQRGVLEEFEARAAKGEDIQTMAFAEIVEVENSDKKQLYFMKALATEAVCLACHGQNLAPELQAKLAELYPDDRATGYQLGQVRGAILVQKELE